MSCLFSRAKKNSPEVIRFVSNSFVALTQTQACSTIIAFHSMHKQSHPSYSDFFQMEDAHTKSWNDHISIDDLDDLNNLERELNERDDSFSLDERHLQTSVDDRHTPHSRRTNLLSVSPLKFLRVSPLQIEAVNCPSSFDNNHLRKPTTTSFQTLNEKTQSFKTKPQVEECSFHVNEDSPFRTITKPISPQVPRNNFAHTNGFHSPKNSPSNGFHSPKNSPINGFHSPITQSPSAHQQHDDFCSRYLSATPNHQLPNEEEEEEEEFKIEEEYFPQATSPPSTKVLNLSDLQTNGGPGYFDTEHVKRKLFDDSELNEFGEQSIQHQLKELFDSMEDDDTYSDIVEITSPLLNLSKSFVSLESSPSPYKNGNSSRESYHLQHTNGSARTDNSFDFDTEFNTSFHNPSSNGFHKPVTNTYTSSYHSNTSFNTIKPKLEERAQINKPVQKVPSREFDVKREQQLLMEQQQRLENILKSLNQRK